MKNSITKLYTDQDIKVFIGQFLRYGVLTACVVAIIGGIMYLYNHGMEVVPDYGTFQGELDSYTTLSGIWNGLLKGSATEIMQFGVVLLVATPILRIVLSLFSFVLERDRLYVCITLIVLCVILFSLFSGMKV